MPRLTDTEAIATWERDDPPDPNAGRAQPYVCVSCAWRGRGDEAYAHHRATGHAVRGHDWPRAWGEAVFSAGVGR